MSRAFDTIRRRVILGLIEDARCKKDNVALVRYVLSDTTIKIQIDRE